MQLALLQTADTPRSVLRRLTSHCLYVINKFLRQGATHIHAEKEAVVASRLRLHFIMILSERISLVGGR